MSSSSKALSSADSRSRRDTPSPATIFVVDDVEAVRETVTRCLTKGGYQTVAFEGGESCLGALSQHQPDAIFLDLEMPGMSGLDTLERILEVMPRVPVIILTANDELSAVVTAVKAGAYDYLVKPCDSRKILTTARNAVERLRLSMKVVALERETQGAGIETLIGDSPPMRELYRKMDRLSASDITVLLYGESGTGKELIARALHRNSPRRASPFVAVNCAAIPEHLIESELFGHERGAFTGAADKHIGKFELANRGVLFLDEIGELSKAVQAKLLRALQERVLQRVGGNREIRSDFRLIAATHQDLAGRVRAGRFREDLYFRIAVFELSVPPLRARGKDALLLADHFRREFSRTEGRDAEFSRGAFEWIERYGWPGNVRELQNAIQRAVVMAENGVILPEYLVPRSPTTTPMEIGLSETSPRPEPTTRQTENTETLNLMELERSAVGAAIGKHPNDPQAAASALGISRATLYRKMKRHRLSR